MTTFYKNYVKLCAQKNVSLSAAAEAVGLSRTSPNGWKKGKQPSDVTLQKLSDYFDCSISELIEKDKETQATEALKTLLADFGALSTEFEEIQTLQALLLNSTIDQIKEALTGLDTGKKFDLAMFLLNDVKGNEDK